MTPSLLEKALLGSGRPILFTPQHRIAQPPKHVVIEWNGNAPAARAVLAAQPLLMRAEHVDIVHVEGETPPQASASQLVEFLLWHGLQYKDHSLQKSGGAMGKDLLNAANELSADVCVMGAYAQNWYEEVVLGSTTQFVLESSQISLFIMH